VTTEAIKLATIVGARPQFIKAAPVSRAIEHSSSSTPVMGASSDQIHIDEVLIHTGQHYDEEMSDVFFKSLKLKNPKHNLHVGSASHGKQLASMLEGLETVLESEHPDLVLVYGDTNSTLAGALISDRLQIPVIHVEAGLRSFNRRMPEEANRILTDHISSLLFAPTPTAVGNLRAEGISEGVHLVGDVMHEAALSNAMLAESESTILQNLGLAPQRYSLATVHRAENTDDPSRLSGITRALLKISRSQAVVWPMHPRTRRGFSADDLSAFATAGLRVIGPADYLDMLALEKNANVILTDSGGVQKEAYWFHVPCVTLREETEWVETVESGWNHLAGASEDSISSAFDDAHRRVHQDSSHPLAYPLASELIVKQIKIFVSNHIRKPVVAR
jgi:UDP-GlcNAc3NAcA epimerase